MGNCERRCPTLSLLGVRPMESHGNAPQTLLGVSQYSMCSGLAGPVCFDVGCVVRTFLSHLYSPKQKAFQILKYLHFILY